MWKPFCVSFALILYLSCLGEVHSQLIDLFNSGVNKVQKDIHKVHCDFHNVGNRIINANIHNNECEDHGNNEQSGGQFGQVVRNNDGYEGSNFDQGHANFHEDQNHGGSQNSNVGHSTEGNIGIHTTESSKVEFKPTEGVISTTVESRSSSSNDTSTIELSKERETRDEGEGWVVSCKDTAGEGVHWVGPDGTVLTAETKPYVGDGQGGQILYFENVKKDFEGVYSCSNGLGVKKYYLKIIAVTVATPASNETTTRRIIVAGSNCDEGWRADTRGICRELVD